MSLNFVSITIKPIKTFHDRKNVLKISPALASYWKINVGSDYTLNISTKQIKMKIEVSDLKNNEVQLSTQFLSELSFPINQMNLFAQINHTTNTIYFAPIIALMTEIVIIDREKPYFRSIHTFCEEIQELISQYGGFFFIFQIQDIRKEGIIGYYFDQEQWVKSLLPFPNVVYNRIHSRLIEAHPFAQAKLEILRELNIPIFNQGFFSKWEIHQLISSNEILKSFLPTTELLTEQNLEEFLTNHQDIYLKPTHGSLGRNIIHLCMRENRIYADHSIEKSEMNPQQFSDVSQAFKWLEPYIQNRTYLMQKTVPLLKYRDRPVDFRVLVNKNFQQKWIMTSIVARISAPNQLVSNIARGGQIVNAEQTLSELFNPETSVQILSLMKELAIEVATFISNERKNAFCCELGIDMGVDEQSRLWIIEVNSKPSKKDKTHDEKIRPSAKAIIECCYSLAFQHIKNEG
ncbi:YheC/YheD family endospore coat-associated protein [Bacillus massilinigeriensis]|uniref:YheC/YheD family endospore coat-associated protein n=1 Tax=Bacillus massilionigeriensis TaxID=1805475 RepID=UPI000A06DDAF|nr:YheC/YheD family protein [Bacillus massilionigeriensis]